MVRVTYAHRDGDRDHLRTHRGPRGTRNLTQHGAFLREVRFGSTLHHELISWLRSLPLFLDLDQLCVVHACWHERFLDVLRIAMDDGRATDDGFFVVATQKDSAEQAAVKTVLKGPKVNLVDFGLARSSEQG